MNPTGQLQYFQSNVDGKLHPCAICATDTSDTPKPLILEVSPGAMDDLPRAVATTESIVRIAAQNGQSCVALRPTGRGPGSVYQNYGEIDVIEAIEHAAANYAIDRDRITVTGSSMGGAATWYLISHYPDLFAGAAPFCGYCDYRLWEKPGGFTFHMHPWEEPSWRARSAALLVENLEHTPVWMIHGEWDRGVGGGVPVEHSRQMIRLMEEKGFTCKYTEVPETGHGCKKPEIFEEVVPWLLNQKKTQNPGHIGLVTGNLRHNSSYWVSIDQFSQYGEHAKIEATASGESIIVQTENVRTFSLDRQATKIAIDGQSLDVSKTYQRDSEGNWQLATSKHPNQKHPRCSGPISNLFLEGLLLVPGTVGSDEATFFNDWVARDARGYFKNRNGGVHRGGIMGTNRVDLPIIRDTDLTEDDIKNNNLLLYGTPETNAILARFAGQLPITFDGTTIHLSDKTYTSDRVSAFAVFPHPLNAERLVAIHGGVTPDAVTWGSHLDMQLLPDYLVYNGGELLDWGFWGNHWKSQQTGSSR
ncbi:MAG: prolyl oligopeptidase family serine peptidase [Candidatus Latescibacteria bacterium]|nr:prolyl oligopeptidase family serine peptidase [Candidatus Latescibacterota bacterium]